MSAADPAVRRFVRWSWFFCAYLLGVIAFGAFVRITHSGAGCGSHWPTCNGEIVPTSPSLETIIEFSHRSTSGALGLLGVGMVVYAARRYGAHRITWAAVITCVFIVIEGLIGAGLVLAELVADDDSVSRAVIVSLHLVNTLMLTGAAVLMPFWARVGAPLQPQRSGDIRFWAPLLLTALVLTSMSGAVTALGDTLFPVDPTLGEGVLSRLQDDLSPARHFLVRLRIFHPVIAVGAAALAFFVAGRVQDRALDPATTRLARGLKHAVVFQVALGTLNIYLAAPAAMQLAHLLAAQAVWMVAVLMTASAFSPRDLEPPAPPEAAQAALAS